MRVFGPAKLRVGVRLVCATGIWGLGVGGGDGDRRRSGAIGGGTSERCYEIERR